MIADSLQSLLVQLSFEAVIWSAGANQVTALYVQGYLRQQPFTRYPFSRHITRLRLMAVARQRAMLGAVQISCDLSLCFMLDAYAYNLRSSSNQDKNVTYHACYAECVALQWSS
eukprot:3283147-Pleurochrysis_carterae.AAC.3